MGAKGLGALTTIMDSLHSVLVLIWWFGYLYIFGPNQTLGSAQSQYHPATWEDDLLQCEPVAAHSAAQVPARDLTPRELSSIL